MIKELSGSYPIKQLCQVLEVSRSAYYEFERGTSWRMSAEDQALAKELERIFEWHKRRYGSRRLYWELQDLGFSAGRHRIRKLMQLLSLKAIQPKSFVPKTTRTDDSKVRSPNLLLELDLPPQSVNEVLVGDITYLPSESGWLYLAAWMDLFSRFIVGWQIADHMGASLVTEAFHKAMFKRRPPPGLIAHSDGGGQYKALVFRKTLKAYKCQQSMTRKENHYDNAFMESLFSRIKAELLSDYPRFKDLADARLRVFEYIEGYYNTMRRHSSLGYLSPMEYEKRMKGE